MLQKRLQILRSNLSDLPMTLNRGKLSPSQETQAVLAGPSRLQIGLWALVIFVACLLFAINYQDYQIGAHFQDDVSYIVLAKSLLQSDTFGLINGPGAVSPTHYPVGFPLVLAPVLYFFGDNWDALRLVSLLATIINTGLLFFGWSRFSRRRSYWWGLAIAGTYALSPLVVDQSRMVMSEPVFTMFCLIALFLAEQAADQREGRGWVIWMSLSLLSALLIRTVGVTLILAVFGYLLWRRGLKFVPTLALVCVLMGLFVGLLFLTTPVTLRDLLPSGYIDEATGGGEGGFLYDFTVGYPMYKITQYFGVYLRQVLVPVGGGDAEQRVFEAVGLGFQPLVLGLSFALVTGLGFLAWIRQEGLRSFNVFPLVYLGIIYFWAWEGVRFLYPINSQLVFAFLLGIEAILVWISGFGRSRPLFGRVVPVVMFVLVLALFLANLYKSATLSPSAAHVGDLYARSAWLKENVPPTAVVLTEEPLVDYINGGYPTVLFQEEYASAAALAQDLERNKIDYVVVGPALGWQPDYIPGYSFGTNQVVTLLRELDSDKITLVHSEPDRLIHIYRVHH